MGLECMGLDSVSLEPEGLEFMGPGGGGWARLMGLEFMGPIIKQSSNIIKRETGFWSGKFWSGKFWSGQFWRVPRPYVLKKVANPYGHMDFFSYL